MTAVSRRAGHLAVALVLVAVAVLGVATRPAWAWWSATAPGTATVRAGTIPAPVLSCEFLNIASGIRFSWPAVPGATSYTLHYGSSTKSVPPGSDPVTTNVTGTTGVTLPVAYVETLRAFPPTSPLTTWTSEASNQVSYRLVLSTGLCPVPL